MLVLSRRRNEVLSVYPGPGYVAALAAALDVDPAKIATALNDPIFKIDFTITEIRGDKVRVGVEADEAWRVDRKEVADAIRAAQTKPSTGDAA